MSSDVILAFLVALGTATAAVATAVLFVSMWKMIRKSQKER